MDASGGEVRRINVVYFLSRMGKIDHPHLIRVHHLHRKGVRLRDVKRWMSDLRGKAMPDSFAWEYKSGYVWQDLLEDDHLITPVSDNEYVLKGSLITSSISPSNQDEIKRTVRIEGGESEGSGSESTQTDEFRMEGCDRTVEETKGEDRTENKTGRRMGCSSHVFKRLLTCRTVETNDAPMLRVRRGESDRLPVRVNVVDGSRRVLGTEGIHHQIQRPSNHASSGGR
ncbi:hypothetical protein QJS04_geneDACA014629 [Acorus gramineus]|uniref:SOSEKI DIX-like domain-containing protein n=1 Tax=Acorus gramineus TaxID=55184 RepID=A0AAV9ATG1_ACOGR|nr:hypothetical protein QJS04_geneDACA014629 [Acorus gramineus]